MAKRFYLINDPGFCNYVYRCLRNTPNDVILQLNDKERNVFRNNKNMRCFADSESLERRLLMLTRIGVSFTVVAAPLDFDVDEILDRTDEEESIEPEGRVRLIEAMSEGRMFVMGSKQLLMATHLAAVNSHSQIYALNPEYLALQQEMKTVEIEVYTQKHAQAERGFEILARTVLATLRASDDALELGAGVTPAEIKMLLVLFKYNGKFLHHDQLAAEMGFQVRSGLPRKISNSLVKKKMIHHMPGSKTENEGRGSRFTILENGINAVMHYLKYIAKSVQENKL